MNCPECGAPDDACEARYHECLVKEFTDTGYGAVHHLTVATYMLQHSSKLTIEGWLYERELLSAARNGRRRFWVFVWRMRKRIAMI